MDTNTHRDGSILMYDFIIRYMETTNINERYSSSPAMECI